ncbi:phosphoenolpyruvate mutase [Alphaproteobacteria bacterium]|nr:phosphoenolpyruvate mutase [Alphaproteobacteria bacterium]
MPSVYIGLSLDALHHGHINLIKVGRSYGDVTIGLITDAALAKNKRLPFLNWDQRKAVAENLVGVVKVIEQNEWDYSVNIKALKPDFMIHGDNWDYEPPYLRTNAVEALAQYGGKLIETPHTKGISSSAMAKSILDVGTTPDYRRQTLQRLLNCKPLSQFLEAHSPISALIAENVCYEQDGSTNFFDGFWSSSLTDSTEMGKPDIEALDINTRLSNINNIFDVTTKPLIMDADTGGKAEHFAINVRSMERLGISAVIIEDKTGLKKNSLFGNDVDQSQEEPIIFGDKIRNARDKLVSNDFMIIARIESLILEKGLEDALERARIYVDHGAHGIMIHSREKSPDEIFKFSDAYKKEHPDIPLVVVPTSFNTVVKQEFEDAGVNILIYANHMLRSSYPAMWNTALGILKHGRTEEIEHNLISINEILDLIPGTK